MLGTLAALTAVTDLSLRDQREMMERPFFSLSKRKRLKPISYESRNGIFVRVTANPEFGMATIWDTDVLIWAASVLNEMRKRGDNDLPRTLQFHPFELLKSIKRRTGGREYKLLRDALGRLQSTTVVTNIRGNRGKKTRQFSWVESWTDLQDEASGASRGMTLTLSEWFYEGILMDGGLLSINPVYFSITGGRERWLYRVARKHAGGAGAEGFAIALSTLFKKSGAEGTYRRFKFEMLAIVQENNLPQFTLSLDYGKGEPLLRMTRRQPQPAMPLQTSVPSKRQAASNSQSRPSLPLLQPQRALSSETLDRLRRECPGLDLYELQSEFDAWIADKPAHMPAYYEKAFAGFVRHRYAKQA